MTVEQEVAHIEAVLASAVQSAYERLVAEQIDRELDDGKTFDPSDSTPAAMSIMGWERTTTEAGENAHRAPDGRLWTDRVERVHPTKEIGWTFVTRSYRVHLGLSLEVEPSEQSQLWNRMG